MTPLICPIGPDTVIGPDTLIYPDGVECSTQVQPGGGGYGALMSRRHFERYEVAGKWRNVKRVRVPTGGSK